MRWFRLSITVPTTNQRDWPMVVSEAQERMIETFGGYSQYEQTGGWRGKDQDHFEPSILLYTYAQDWDQKEIVWPFMRDLARFAKNYLNEEAVLVTIEPVQGVHFV